MPMWLKSDSYMCVQLWGNGGDFVTQNFYFDIMVDSKQMFLKEGGMPHVISSFLLSVMQAW